MNIVLLIVVVLLALITWIFTIYLGWKYENGASLGFIRKAPFLVRWERGIRLTRRGWYGASLHAKQVLNWGNRKAENAIVALFPKSAPVFKKPDEMTGLNDGPSSFFLKSISPEKTQKKRLSRTKKMV